MLKRSVIAAGVGLLIALSLVGGHSAWADPIEDAIAGDLVCQCGCGLTVAACASAMECNVGDQMRAIIRQRLGQGETREQIVAYFVSQYGEKVLAAPTKQGFNLVAWFTPFLALLAGIGVVYGALRAWVYRKREGPLESRALSEEDLARYGERVDHELERFG